MQLSILCLGDPDHRLLDLLDVDFSGDPDSRANFPSYFLDVSWFFPCPYFCAAPLRLMTISQEIVVPTPCPVFPLHRNTASSNIHGCLQSTSCFSKLCTNKMNNGLEKLRFLTASKNVSHYNHRAEDFDKTCPAASGLNCLITVVLRCRTDAILSLFKWVLLQSARMPTKMFSICVLNFSRVRWAWVRSPFSFVALSTTWMATGWSHCHHDVGTTAVVHAFVFRRWCVHRMVKLLLQESISITSDVCVGLDLTTFIDHGLHKIGSYSFILRRR